MEAVHLIVGLGNPGREYDHTRHNAGFGVVGRLAKAGGWGWRLMARCQARVARGTIGGRPVLFGQPQTYMNRSGEAVAAVMSFFRVAPERLLVVVDDADLPLGTLRLRSAGSSGGHHGLESIEVYLGTRQFARLRLGIGRRRPEDRAIAGHVLGRFSPDEATVFGQVLAQAADAARCWVTDGVGTAMNRYNGVVVAPDQAEGN